MSETTEALIERVLAEHTLADLGEPQHRTCVAAAITQALAERGACGDRMDEMTCTLPSGHTGMHVDERVFGEATR